MYSKCFASYIRFDLDTAFRIVCGCVVLCIVFVLWRVWGASCTILIIFFCVYFSLFLCRSLWGVCTLLQNCAHGC